MCVRVYFTMLCMKYFIHYYYCYYYYYINCVKAAEARIISKITNTSTNTA